MRRQFHAGAIVGSVLLVLVWAGGLHGQLDDNGPVPDGNEFQVNTLPDVDVAPRVAIDEQGRSVMAWITVGPPPPEGSGVSVRGRRFDASGQPQGAPFRIDETAVTPLASNIDVAMDAGGNFVVVWSGALESVRGIVGQRYSADGTPLGGNFVINGEPAGPGSMGRSSPSIGMSANGRFVVAWNNTGGGSASTVFARQYDEQGNPLGNEFAVSGLTAPGFNSFPSVAVSEGGAFVVAWLQASSVVAGVPDSIRARRYGSDGRQEGDELQVTQFANALSFTGPFVPSIGIDSAGNFAVSWMTITSGEPFRFDTFVRRYGATGLLRDAGDLLVTSATFPTGLGRPQQLAMGATGRFSVAWSDSTGIVVRRFGADGEPSGAEGRVSSPPASGARRQRPVHCHDPDREAGYRLGAWRTSGRRRRDRQ